MTANKKGGIKEELEERKGGIMRRRIKEEAELS